MTEDRSPGARELAARLRARRLELGLTQEQVAERTGFSQRHVSSFEVGTRIPTLPTLSRLARALETTEAELLQGLDRFDGAQGAAEV